MSLTWKEKLELIKLLRIDVFLMLFFVSFSISSISLNQLIEDKICLNVLKLNETICLNLEHTASVNESDKNYIIGTAAVFKNYQTILLTLPGILLSLFVGYWIDNYPRHLKYILAAPALGGTIGSLIVIYNTFYFESDFMYLLASDVLRGISGGFATIYTGVYTYITRKTPAKYRALRFAILEFFSFVATPISLYLGGFILTTEPFFDNQPRNYIGVFLVSAICSTIAFIWVIVFVRDADSSKPSISVDSDEQIDSKKSLEEDDIGDEQPDGIIIKHVAKKPPTSKGCWGNFMHTFTDIFNCKNVQNMFQICIKQRPNGLRRRIWHSMLMASFTLLAYMGDTAIGFPFAQKVYHWDAKYYSNVSSLVSLVPPLGTTILLPLLSRTFGFLDTSIGILGCVSMIAGMIIRGGFLTPTAYFISIFVGMLGGLMPISIRAFLSRMITFDEIGQVYSLLSAIESCAPAISSLFYSQIFKLTISTYPGTVYLFVSIILFYPLFVLLWLDYTRGLWYNFNKTTTNNHPDNESQSTLEVSQTIIQENSFNTSNADLEHLIN